MNKIPKPPEPPKPVYMCDGCGKRYPIDSRHRCWQGMLSKTMLVLTMIGFGMLGLAMILRLTAECFLR